MSCPHRFHTQCNVWTVYCVLSVSVFLATASVLYYNDHTLWQILLKSGVAFGTTTCVIWWLWVMKKLRDMAVWWIDLKHNIDTAAQLLAESKQDLRDIKELSKQGMPV